MLTDISYLENERFIWNYDQIKGCYHCDDIKYFSKKNYIRKEYTEDEVIEMIRDPRK